MNLRSLIESRYVEEVSFFERSQAFENLESGIAEVEFYNEFLDYYKQYNRRFHLNLGLPHLKKSNYLFSDSSASFLIFSCN